MIERLSPTQLDQVMNIWLSSNLEAHSFIDPDYWKSQVPEVKVAIGKAEVYCFNDPDVVAFIGLDPDYIAGLFVEKEYRSRGIGKQLLDFVKARHDHLSLDAYTKNEGAIKFYQRNGFSIVSQTDDEVHMEWSR